MSAPPSCFLIRSYRAGSPDLDPVPISTVRRLPCLSYLHEHARLVSHAVVNFPHDLQRRERLENREVHLLRRQEITPVQEAKRLPPRQCTE